MSWTVLNLNNNNSAETAGTIAHIGSNNSTNSAETAGTIAMSLFTPKASSNDGFDFCSYSSNSGSSSGASTFSSVASYGSSSGSSSSLSIMC